MWEKYGDAVVALIVVLVVVGFVAGVTFLGVRSDNHKDAQFKQECIDKGGEYVNFEHDNYAATCDYNGHRYYR